ncbi:cytochrome [Mycobacterium triplex]|uniref:Cytochrome n=1 Tax=Mycobacterium triplex TaxID=47839 RepID=A0ABX3W8R6_9MYCO|nr:cytochrome [Mycobacterium triplex]
MVFDPYSPEFFADPHPVYRRLRDEAPVYYSSEHHFYALSRHDDVVAAIRDFETYASSRGITLDLVKRGVVVEGHILQMMDPPEHRRMRGLVNKVFTPRAIASQEPMVRATINRYAARLDTEAFDVVRDFSAYFPVEIITTMLGVPQQDRQQVRLWQDVILHRAVGQTGMSDSGMQALADNESFYRDLIKQRRAHPRNDMISALTTVEVDRGDGTNTRLEDREIAGFCMQLGAAGAETVTKLVGSAVVLFAEHPDQWRELDADRSKIPAAVEEVLRYDGPVQYNCRFSLKDVRIHGTTIPENSAVMLLMASANRDERAFQKADSFDINRDRNEGLGLGFGYGIHSCLGAALARMESAVALDCLLDVMPEFEVVTGDLQRVFMTNVNGYSHVPVRLRSRPTTENSSS